MSFHELPNEILLEHILLQLDAGLLLKLSETSRSFYRLCNDPALWQRLVEHDFSLPMMIQTSHSWKRVYKILQGARTYTWGENYDKRLGFIDEDCSERDTSMHQIMTPRELRFLSNKGITDIVGGGWSFHVLDRWGRVWMWGWMQPRHPMVATGLPNHSLVKEPTQVRLPSNIRIQAIASGRMHAIALDQAGGIWHWANCWQPIPVHLKHATGHPIQVTAGSRSSTVLTSTGELFLIPFPFPTTKPVVVSDSPVTTNRLFNDLEQTGDDTFCQITALDKCTIAMSRSGRIFKFQTTLQEHERFVLYPASVAIELKPFHATLSESDDQGASPVLSGQFRHFAIRSKGKVLVGQQDDPADKDPIILGDSVCKVIFGDHHFGALTSDGRLLTWGRNCSGALGHGYDYDESSVKDDMQVVESLTDMFVFAAGFGGSHSGCLAVPRHDLFDNAS